MMADEIDWSLTTWEGNRRRQHEEFLRLSFRQKVAVIEQLNEVAAAFAALRQKRLEQERGGTGKASSGPR
jgi:hypothetical protein